VPRWQIADEIWVGLIKNVVLNCLPELAGCRCLCLVHVGRIN